MTTAFVAAPETPHRGFGGDGEKCFSSHGFGHLDYNITLSQEDFLLNDMTYFRHRVNTS